MHEGCVWGGLVSTLSKQVEPTLDRLDDGDENLKWEAGGANGGDRWRGMGG